MSTDSKPIGQLGYEATLAPNEYRDLEKAWANKSPEFRRRWQIGCEAVRDHTVANCLALIDRQIAVEKGVAFGVHAETLVTLRRNIAMLSGVQS